MNILAIDTTSSNLVVALKTDSGSFFEMIETGKTGHSKLLLETIDRCLEKAGLGNDDIENYAVCVGPGSFTGIRIGVALATALSTFKSANRIQVNTFDLLAYNRLDAIVAVEAGHGNTYLATVADGKIVSTDFLKCEDSAQVDTKSFVYDTIGGRAETLLSVAEQKLGENDLVKVFEPYYMRKSQAERAKDEF